VQNQAQPLEFDATTSSGRAVELGMSFTRRS
jgi:hypothetical protein